MPCFLARGCEKVQQVLEFAAEVNFGNVICGKVALAILVPENRTGEIICQHWDGDNTKDCGNCPGVSNTLLLVSQARRIFCEEGKGKIRLVTIARFPFFQRMCIT